MSKQDKRVKKAKKAKKQADEIVAKSVAKAKASTKATDEKWASERVDGCSDEAFALGCRVRELREAGEPWWAIARDLELQGYGQSATTGKKGAARARSAYKAAFGDFPRTFTKGKYKGKAEKNAHILEMKKQRRADLKAQAKAGKSVIDPNLPDEDVAEMLKGRKIRWFSTEYVPEGIDYEAAVHPRAPLYIEGEGEERVIEFREQHRRAPVGIREIPAQTRTVRLRQVYSVK